MKKITDKQAKFLRSLLQQAGRSTDVDHLSRWQACQMISELLAKMNAKPPFERRLQAELPLSQAPPPEKISPELVEFKRWAREVYHRGELTIQQLCELQDARFGVLKLP